MNRIERYCRNITTRGLIKTILVCALLFWMMMRDVQEGRASITLPVLMAGPLLTFLIRDWLGRHALRLIRPIYILFVVSMGALTIIHFRHSGAVPLPAHAGLIGGVSLYMSAYFWMVSAGPHVIFLDLEDEA